MVIIDLKHAIGFNLRDLFGRLNIAASKKCNFGKAQILMIKVHPNRYNVWITRMIEKSTHVSIVVGIDAMLRKQLN